MRNLLLLLALCGCTSLHAGRIAWDVITVNHFWTIFDTIKPGDIVSAELIGAQEGEYQFKNKYFTGIEGCDYFFFIPHPGPGYPIRVTTRTTLYGKRLVSQDWGDSKELTEYRAGSVYDNLNMGNSIAIDGTRYIVAGQYPRIDTMRIFTLMSNDNKQKNLILKNREDVGNVFLACEDISEEKVISYEGQDEEFDSCCKVAAMCVVVFLKKIVAKNNHDKLS